MTFWIGVLVVAVGLIISIAIHEIGHMLPAKKFGVRVPQYFVGFGPTLWSTTRGETEYGFKAIPLGGFVRMIGMYPPTSALPAGGVVPERKGLRGWAARITEEAREVSSEELEPGDDKRAFYALSVPKKLAVMFGGPVTNLIICAVLFTVLLCGIGIQTYSNSVSTVTPCLDSSSDTCTDPAQQSPAALAGLQAGDTVVSWGGVSTPTWEELSAAIRDGGTGPIDVVVDRGGQQQTITVTPQLAERPTFDAAGAPIVDDAGNPVTEQVPYVGIAPSIILQRQSITTVPAVVGEQLVATAQVVVTLPVRLYSIARSLFGGAERDPNVIGIIGVGRLSGEISEATAPSGLAAQAGSLLAVLASLNMALFVFNMIPLPPLDGGHIAGALYEGARRKIAKARGRANPGFADTAKLMPLTYIMFFLFIGMAALLAIADIVKPVTLT